VAILKACLFTTISNTTIVYLNLIELKGDVQFQQSVRQRRLGPIGTEVSASQSFVNTMGA
jgi:hypothetical protein